MLATASKVTCYDCLHLQSILLATQHSFAAMKRRLGSKTATGIFYMERPFFDVDVELKVTGLLTEASTQSPSTVLSTSLPCPTTLLPALL